MAKVNKLSGASTGDSKIGLKKGDKGEPRPGKAAVKESRWNEKRERSNGR